MSKIKHGFTLAEVLVTMGIVGVIAAMTIPTLVRSSNDRYYGPALGRAVNQTETAIANIMQRAGVSALEAIRISDLYSAAPDGRNLNDYIANEDYLLRYTTSLTGLTPVDADKYDTSTIRDYNRNSNVDELSDDTSVYKLNKNNAFVIIKDITGIASNPGIDNYLAANKGLMRDDVVLTRVFIDVNGADAPNRVGKDVFLFGLKNNGKLVPAGSNAYNKNIFNDTVDLYDTADGCDKTVANTFSCAARVKADGWKILYK